MNILRYSQIKYLGKVSIFWYFGEEFPHFYQCFKTLFQILMKNANNFVESMIYALLLGKSFSLTFGKCFLGFRKIFTPAEIRNDKTLKTALKYKNIASSRPIGRKQPSRGSCSKTSPDHDQQLCNFPSSTRCRKWKTRFIFKPGIYL